MIQKIKKWLYKHSMGYTFLPLYIAINITNKCNRTCSFCAYHGGNVPNNYHNKWFKAQPDMIDMDKLIRFFSKIPRFLLSQVAITGKGETLYHMRLIDLCDYLENRKINFSITTNGDRMNSRFVEKLLSYKYCTVRVSLYEQEQVDTWIVNDVFGVKGRFEFFNMTGEPLEGIGVMQGYITRNFGVEHERAMPKDFNISDYCNASFNFLTINTDGSIVPCYSYDETGHIEDSFWKIWNGRRVRRYRRQAVNGRDMEFADCKNCGVNMY